VYGGPLYGQETHTTQDPSRGSPGRVEIIHRKDRWKRPVLIIHR